jgi:hypothetical protein
MHPNESKTPQLNVLIKLHKETQPLRPVVNYRCALTYKLSKVIAKWLKQNLNLPYTYNSRNTLQSAVKLKNLKM